MRDFIINLFNNKYYEPIIRPYNIFHIILLLLIVGLIVGLYFIFRNKEQNTKKKFLDILANILLVLLLSDYLIRAVLEDGIETSRLPFHMCTLLGIIVPISRFDKHFTKFKNAIAIVSIVAGFYYFVYPSTAMGMNAFCYTPLQTILYPAILISYGILSIALNDIEIDFKKDYLNIIIFVLFEVIWASFGNMLYPDLDYFFLQNRIFKEYVPFIQVWMTYLLLPSGYIGTCFLIFPIYNLIEKRANK